MESDERLCRTYDQLGKPIYVLRLTDFKQGRNEQLPLISTLLEALSRQSETESYESWDSFPDEGLHQAFSI